MREPGGRWCGLQAPVQGERKRRADAEPPKPAAEEWRRGRSLLWVEVTDDAGRRAVARLQGPDSYDLNVQTALAVIGQVAAGNAPPGFPTPAKTYGLDFILELGRE